MKGEICREGGRWERERERELWKNLKVGLCRWNFDFNKEIEESTEQAERRKKKRPEQITAGRLERTASRLSGKTGKSAVRDVLGHELPGGVDVLFDGNGSKSCGCKTPGQVQADCWIVRDETSTGLHLAELAPSTAERECSDCGLCRRTLADAGLFLLFSRMAERYCGGAVGR